MLKLVLKGQQPSTIWNNRLNVPSNHDDTGLSSLLIANYNWKPAENWSGRHRLQYYEIRYNENDSLNFRNISLQEGLRRKMKVGSFSGYYQINLNLSHYDLDDEAFMWNTSVQPSIHIQHPDQKGLSQLTYVIFVVIEPI